MVLAYGALLKAKEELEKTLDEKNRTLKYFVKQNQRHLQLKKSKSEFYCQADDLQKKISEQLHQLAKSLSCLSSSDRAQVPRALWGHNSIKKWTSSPPQTEHCAPPSPTEHSCASPSRHLSTFPQCLPGPGQGPDPPTKNSEHGFIKKMSRTVTRLESKYGGAPPPNTRPSQSVVPADLIDLWINILSLYREDSPVSVSVSTPQSRPPRRPSYQTWEPRPPPPFHIESLLRPRPPPLRSWRPFCTSCPPKGGLKSTSTIGGPEGYLMGHSEHGGIEDITEEEFIPDSDYLGEQSEMYFEDVPPLLSLEEHAEEDPLHDQDMGGNQENWGDYESNFNPTAYDNFYHPDEDNGLRQASYTSQDEYGGVLVYACNEDVDDHLVKEGTDSSTDYDYDQPLDVNSTEDRSPDVHQDHHTDCEGPADDEWNYPVEETQEDHEQDYSEDAPEYPGGGIEVEEEADPEEEPPGELLTDSPYDETLGDDELDFSETQEEFECVSNDEFVTSGEDGSYSGDNADQAEEEDSYSEDQASFSDEDGYSEEDFDSC